MLVLVYPTAAAWFSQYDQSRLIETRASEVADGDVSPSIAQQLAEAHEYNDLLSAGALLQANANVPTGAGTSEGGQLDYDSLLADPTGVMARLRIPAIDVDLPIYHGTSDATLLKGVGHLEGTSLPVGGEGTHSVLTGHRGLASATLFTNLDKVKEGDTFTIEVLDQVLTYQVIRTQVVDPSDTASLRATAGEDLVTLVTCTPLGINSQRILVTGERITPTPQEDLDAAGSVPDIPGFPWWAAALAAGVVLVGVFVWRAGYPRTPRRAGRTAARPGGVDAPE
jgi:sortase A